MARKRDITSGLATIFVLLAILRESTPLENSCPPAETIHPCTCKTVTPKDAENWVTCDKIESLAQLTPLVASLRGFIIHKFKLSSYGINFLPSNLFFQTHISEIQITGTEIKSFTQSEEEPFLGLENRLESISLRHCRLGTGIQWKRFYALHSLTYLDVSYNTLTEENPKWFRFVHSTLSSFIFKGNRVAMVADDAFSKLLELKFLDLSENKLKVLKRSMFPKPSRIVFLNLSNNKLSFLPEDIFHQMLFLKRVHMMYNYLQTFDEGVWKPLFGQVNRIDVEGNPIVCDLSLCWITLYELPDHFYGECLEPENVKGRSLRSINFWEIKNCTNPKIMLKNSLKKTTSLPSSR